MSWSRNALDISACILIDVKGIMNRWFYDCQKMVEANTTLQDRETIDLLAASILALAMYRGFDVFGQIAVILKNIIIISDNRSVLDVQHQVINNYKEDKELRNANACVTRRFSLKNNICNEVRYLIIPKLNIRRDPIGTLEKTTHELIHLIRYKDAKKEGNRLVFSEGICVKSIDLNTNITYRRDYTLEETIVQYGAKRATEALLARSSELSQNLLFKRVDKKKYKYRSEIYEAHVKFFEILMEDSTAKRIVEETYETGSVKPLSVYYNAVMDDNGAFLRLSNNFNKMDIAIDEDNVGDAKKYAELLKQELLAFSDRRRKND